MQVFTPDWTEQLQRVLGHVGGGIHKRVDENRELLELLQREAPDLLVKNPWVVGWIKANDDFLTEIGKSVPAIDGRFAGLASTPGSGFPRPWPLKT